jgi:hypothetical protein
MVARLAVLTSEEVKLAVADALAEVAEALTTTRDSRLARASPSTHVPFPMVKPLLAAALPSATLLPT